MKNMFCVSTSALLYFLYQQWHMIPAEKVEEKEVQMKKIEKLAIIVRTRCLFTFPFGFLVAFLIRISFSFVLQCCETPKGGEKIRSKKVELLFYFLASVNLLTSLSRTGVDAFHLGIAFSLELSSTLFFFVFVCLFFNLLLFRCDHTAVQSTNIMLIICIYENKFAKIVQSDVECGMQQTLH